MVILLPDRSCSWAAEDQTNLSKEFSLVHGSKDDSSILTHHFNSTTVDEKHLHQKSVIVNLISRPSLAKLILYVTLKCWK